MPFRRLPDTDAGRLLALQTANSKVLSLPAGTSVLSPGVLTRLAAALPQFQSEVGDVGVALAAQTAATGAEDTQEGRTRMWSSHFYQTLNLAIARGVIAASARAFYQLDVSDDSVPEMGTEAELALWAGRVSSGETARVAAGGTLIPFPTAAEVAAELTSYNTLRAAQSNRRDAHDAELEEVAALRPTVDLLIRDIWDEVEFAFRHDSASSRRAKAREYGVVYTSRPGETPEFAAPTGMTLTPGPGNTLAAAWNAVDGAPSYRILKQQVGTDPDFIVAGTSNTTTFPLGTFTPGATIRVKVRAFSGATEGPDSPVVEATIASTP